MADGRAEGEKARRPPPAGGERAAPLAAGPWGALWGPGDAPGGGGRGECRPRGGQAGLGRAALRRVPGPGEGAARA